MQDFIGTAEVARLLGVDRSTVTRRAAAGDLEPAIRVPGYRGPMLFERAVIEAMAAS